MYDWGFWLLAFVLIFLVLQKVFIHVRLVILERILCVNVCAVLQGI